MTVESTLRKVTYEGNGVARSFPVPFEFSQATDLSLVFTNAAGVDTAVTSNFQVVTVSGGTSVTYPVSGSPMASGTRLTIFRETPQTQIVALETGGAFAPDVLEHDGFDRIVMMVQELKEALSRAIKVSINGLMTPEELLAGILGVGKEVDRYWQLIKDAMSQIAGVAGSSIVISSGTTEPRPLQERFADIVNVKDFGARGDGSTDDTTALIAACAFAYANNTHLLFPAGEYRATANIPLFRHVKKIGTGVVQRNYGDVLYSYHVSPTSSQANTLYVLPQELAAWDADGITPDAATNISNAVTRLNDLGEAAMSGQWIIHMLPGEYYDKGFRPYYLPTFGRTLIIRGEIEIGRISQDHTHDPTRQYYSDAACETSPYHYSSDTWEDARRAGLYVVAWKTTWRGDQQIENYAWRQGTANTPPQNILFENLRFVDWKKEGFEAVSGAIVSWNGGSANTKRCRFYNCGVGVWNRSGFSTHHYDNYIFCGVGIRHQYSHAGSVGNTEGGRCYFYGCDIGLHVGRNTTSHSDGNHYKECAVCIDGLYLSRAALVESIFEDWTKACFYPHVFATITGASSCTFLPPLIPGTTRPDGSKPFSFSGHDGMVAEGMIGPSKKLNQYVFPPVSSQSMLTGTTERTIVSAGNMGRLFSVPRGLATVSSDHLSQLLLEVHVQINFAGSGTFTLEVCGASASENAALARYTSSAGSAAGMIDFIIRSSQHETAGHTSGYGIARPHMVAAADQRMSISSTYWASYLAGSDMVESIGRLYAKLSNANDTLTIIGWWTEFYRG